MEIERKGEWCQTFPSGTKFWPLDPRQDEIFIEDIAHHLSMICRYNGGCRWHYSVAQHSVLVSEAVQEFAIRHHLEGSIVELSLWGLLHDAAEAYIGDMVRPLKHVPMFAHHHKEAERQLMSVICAAFQIPRGQPQIITQMDSRMLMTEKRVLVANPDRRWADAQGGDAQPFENPENLIEKWTPEHARDRFLDRFNDLMSRRAR